jgi:hypothetical protein
MIGNKGRLNLPHGEPANSRRGNLETKSCFLASQCFRSAGLRPLGMETSSEQVPGHFYDSNGVGSVAQILTRSHYEYVTR